ncbi:MAG: Trm112 family protein [Propionibacteriaceae bacterium]|jgi:uncharacterized protein YbaR (Trm112 family)|nr:Trm112 family protein [Propionibacteriaceae bacterium]
MSITPITPELLSIVVCPVCHTRVAIDVEKALLVCANAMCALGFEIRYGVPVLLVDEARK